MNDWMNGRGVAVISMIPLLAGEGLPRQRRGEIFSKGKAKDISVVSLETDSFDMTEKHSYFERSEEN